jgi:RNA polymerase sigma factor (sigma-70 family)
MSGGRNELYNRSDAQLCGAFKYPTLCNEDAVYLAGLLDDCLYAAATVLDNHTPWISNEYARIVVAVIFRGSKKSYSTVSDRSYITTLPMMRRPDWLQHVRATVSPFRELLLNTLSTFEHTCAQLPAWVVDERGLAKLTALERDLKCRPGALYGVYTEVQYQLQRCYDISTRMARPYLRRVVSVAKQYASTNEPEAFLDNYQNGYIGVITAIGKYDTRFGAFAFFVDIWIKNRMISGISSASNAMALPERVWKHKRILDKHSGKEIDEIADIVNVNADLLRSSAMLLEVRNAAPLLEENDEHHNTDVLDDYHDAESIEVENQNIVNDQLRLYTKHLSKESRIVLGLAFDVNMFNDVPAEDVERETARQLYIAHARDH